MFVGFIAVIVIILVIVTLMSTGALQSSNSSQYAAESKKVHALLSNLQAESKFYYLQNDESYLNISMDYFADHDFAGKNMITANPGMASADWEGWPTGVDGTFPDPYTGPYIQLGGTATDEMRIITSSINDGKSAVFFILKKKTNNIPEKFTSILEKSLAADFNYIGG